MNRRLALAACAAAAAAGCGKPRRKVVAVIPKSTAHVFWVAVEAGARAAAAEFDFDVLWNGPPTEADHSRQIQIVDAMVARRVDGIALAAAERKALAQAVERAAAAGIPVVIFDSGVDSESYVSFVATDNYEAGRLGGRKLGALVGGKGKVASLQHAPGSFSTMDRERGFDDVMAREFPAIEVVARPYAMADRARARAAAENFLAAHPDLAGIFCSTEPSTNSAALALKARGLDGKIRLVGFDSDEAMIAGLRAGVLNAMVVQDPFRIGYEAVKAVGQKLQGRTPPRRIDLPARVVVREDLERADIQRLLNLELKKANP